MSQHWHSGMFRDWDTVNRRLCSPFVHGDGDLRLPKPVRSAILASKPSARGGCRINSPETFGEKQVAELVYLAANYCQRAVLLNVYDIPAPEQK